MPALGTPNFGVDPDKTVDLRFKDNEGSPYPDYRTRKLIDLTEFPPVSGVYVVRYRDKVFGRLRGSSSVLKVGEAQNLFSRFWSYNNKKEASTIDKTLSELLQWCNNARTEFHFMWLLPRLIDAGDAIQIDLYYCSETKIRETQFLLACLDDYLDLPPLNLKLGKIPTSVLGGLTIAAPSTAPMVGAMELEGGASERSGGA